MIETLVSSRCTGCQRCIEVCPANVFAPGANDIPLIARQDDCQSCYMCELYCQADALYVGHDCEHQENIGVEWALATGTLGQYRRESGWDEWAGQYHNLHYLMEGVFRRAGMQNPNQPEKSSPSSPSPAPFTGTPHV
jgi:NAD-dependent dihydropyrimidine dehydrogenase PreA subunit